MHLRTRETLLVAWIYASSICLTCSFKILIFTPLLESVLTSGFRAPVVVGLVFYFRLISVVSINVIDLDDNFIISNYII
jgi:hypothetical protein